MNTEQKTSVQKLIPIATGEKLFKSGSSIHTLSLIAIAKLFSPNRAAHSISLYHKYTQWMDVERIKHARLKGFVTNRFGRIAEMAKEFLARKDSIMNFFNLIVDANANKMVFPISSCIDNEWFGYCTKIYKELGKMIIFPLILLLGINDQALQLAHHCSWTGVREFFKQKLPEVFKRQGEKTNSDNGKVCLLATALRKVIETLH